MEPLTESEIRPSFVNCSQGEAKRLNLPTDLADRDWERLDFLGWVDPRSPLQSYLVVPTDHRGPLGVRLRRNTSTPGRARARMCSLCLTTHPGQGVALMVAARAGRAGRDGNSVGVDVCAELECSSYVRGLLPLPAMSAAHETLSEGERVDRLLGNVRTFVDRVMR